MREAVRAPLRAAAISAFVIGLILFLVNPPSLDGAAGLLTLVVGAAALVLVVAWATVALMGDEGPSEAEFDRIVERSEALAKLPPPEAPPNEFDALVEAAIEGLPEEFHDVLARVPVVVSTLGREHHAYGMYMGDTVARDNYPDRIIIYQDTLLRDFGWDPEVLRAQVERTLRHELAHHLGWGEAGVRELGL
jgi:predicted Zn-dependent protease with MMP-like domain